MEWTNDLIFEFLNLYQNEPTLWNIAIPEHKNKIDAYDAWTRIKNQFKDGTVPIKEMKKKRDNLMSTYRKQRTKVIDSIEDDEEDIYKPEWPFYTIMAAFLDDIYKPRKSTNSEDNVTEKLKPISESMDSSNCSERVSESENRPKRKRKLLKVVDRANSKDDNNGSESLNDENTANENITDVNIADECELYGQLLAKKLIKLDEDDRLILMNRIDNLIFKATMAANAKRKSTPETTTRNTELQLTLSPIYEAESVDAQATIVIRNDNFFIAESEEQDGEIKIEP